MVQRVESSSSFDPMRDFISYMHFNDPNLIMKDTYFLRHLNLCRLYNHLPNDIINRASNKMLVFNADIQTAFIWSSNSHCTYTKKCRRWMLLHNKEWYVIYKMLYVDFRYGNSTFYRRLNSYFHLPPPCPYIIHATQSAHKTPSFLLSTWYYKTFFYNVKDRTQFCHFIFWFLWIAV